MWRGGLPPMLLDEEVSAPVWGRMRISANRHDGDMRAHLCDGKVPGTSLGEWRGAIGTESRRCAALDCQQSVVEPVAQPWYRHTYRSFHSVPSSLHCRRHDKRRVIVSVFFQYLLTAIVLYRPNSETTSTEPVKAQRFFVVKILPVLILPTRQATLVSGATVGRRS